MNDQTIEQEIQAKGLTAPRVTPADIEANIASEYYFTADQGARHAFLDAVAGTGEYIPDNFPPIDPELGLLTFCVLALKNGFTVTGESACASPENFDAELGRKIARENAKQKIWPLMGYLLKEQLYRNELELKTILLKPKELIPGSFEFALTAIKEGKRVARAGWNGGGQWVALTGSLEPREVAALNIWSPHARQFAEDNGGVAKVAPGLLLKNAQGVLVMGWIPSTGDLLATDWHILPAMAQ